MKKLFALLFAITLLLQIPFCVYANTVSTEKEELVLTNQETQTLSIIEKTINKNPNEIQILKSKGVLHDFIDEVDDEMEKYVSSNSNELLEQISNWNISPECTISDIEILAQKYLDKYCDGIQIGSEDFKKLVHKYLDNEDMGSCALADENLKFAPLYLYMCIYDAYVLDNEKTSVQNYSVYKNKLDIRNMTLSDIAYIDSQENFIDTVSPEILNKYLQVYAASSMWPKMNGTNIQTYAQKYAISYNTNYIGMDADCTNFVSQALNYGSLPMNYIASDKTYADKYRETTSRWFHFKTNASKFSVSTSWIRVVDLYDYLSPHYAVYETSNDTNMKPHLKKGFVLQGKPFIGKYKHSVIVTVDKNNNIKYCAHSSDRKDEAIQTFYNGFSKYRVIKTY